MAIKSRKVGNSITLTLPEELNVPENVEFEPSVDSKENVFLKRISELNEEEGSGYSSVYGSVQAVDGQTQR